MIPLPWNSLPSIPKLLPSFNANGQMPPEPAAELPQAQGLHLGR